MTRTLLLPFIVSGILFAQEPESPTVTAPPVTQEATKPEPLPTQDAQQDELVSLSALLDSIRLKESLSHTGMSLIRNCLR